MRPLIVACSLVFFILSCGSSFADNSQTDGRSEKLAIIKNGPLLNALDAADELLSSKDQTIRSLAMEECLKSKERRLREVGFKYFIKNVKKFIVELNVPESKRDELVRIDKLQNNGGRFQSLLHLNTMYVEIDTIGENNQFSGGGTQLGHMNGMIAHGSLILVFVHFGDATMTFSSVEDGYIFGSLQIPNNSFAVKIPL